MNEVLAKIVVSEGKQFIELPEALQFAEPEKDILIRKEDNVLIVSVASLLEVQTSPDFMEDRDQPPPQERDKIV